MKNYSRVPSSDSKPIRLALLYNQISNQEVQLIQQVLTRTYSSLIDVYNAGEIKLLDEAYNPNRNQYDVDILLRYLLKRKKSELALWVINKDIYCKGMNFVFGYAMYYKGAILSIHRLQSQDLIEKEAIHEVGHILGLEHCRNQCVMQYSNSLWEAKMKPSSLCENCIRKLHLL